MFKQKAIKIICVALAVMVALCAPLTASAYYGDELDNMISQYYMFSGKYNRITTNTNYTFETPTDIMRIQLFADKDYYYFSNGYLIIEIDYNVSNNFGDINSLSGSLDFWTEQDGNLSHSFYSNWRDYVTLDYRKYSYNNRYCYEQKMTVNLSALPYGGFEFLAIDTHFKNRVSGNITITNYSLYYVSKKDYENSLDYEKNEVQGSGNDSIDGVAGALPSVDFSGLQNSLEILTQNMMYNGTDCVWTFPALKIPAIENVCPEIKLTGEQPIDIGAWVKKIPSAVLMVLQACCSIGIILFIIYELYSFIIFCMTLKSNQVGKDEESE